MVNASTRYSHRVAYALVATLLLSTAVLLPFALSDVVDDLLEPQAARTFRLTPPVPAGTAEAIHLHVDMIALDMYGRTVTLRVSGHQSCPTACTTSRRILLVSILKNADEAEGLPPAEVIALSPASREANQTLTLPIDGDPIRYPFDRYGMGLGVVVQDVAADASVRTMTAAGIDGLLSITLRMQIPRAIMDRPAKLSADSVPLDAGYSFVQVDRVVLERPLYLQVLTVLLLLLIAAAAAYAVFMRPLDQLVINTGALVLGVWGVRAILLGGDPPGATAVDLSLFVLILFLLVAITIRTFTFLDEATELRLMRRLGRSPPTAGADQPAAPEQAKSASGD